MCPVLTDPIRDSADKGVMEHRDLIWGPFGGDPGDSRTHPYYVACFYLRMRLPSAFGCSL